MQPRQSSHPVRGWIILIGVVGVVSAALIFGGPPVLYATGLWVDGGKSTVDPGFFDHAAQVSPSIATPSPVLTPADSTAAMDAKKVSEKVRAVSRTGLGTLGLSFANSETGTSVYAENADHVMVPASTMKVLSSVAALKTLGPDATFTTSVTMPTAGSIVLVGGGDPFLVQQPDASHPEWASLRALAVDTAKDLLSRGTKTVSLGVDTSLFSGASWHQDWTDSYSSEVSQIVPLWINEGRDSTGVPVANPVEVATTAFIQELTAQGITVKRAGVVADRGEETTIASVKSPPVSAIVEQILRNSDNCAAEVLARHTAIATGQPGSFSGAATAIADTLTSMEISHDDMVIRDGSGLSKENRVTANMLVKAMSSSLHSDRYSAVISGLPLAGATGTLTTRFNAVAGRGQVWAKTGFLAGTHGLTGVLVTRDGNVVVFAMLVNGQASRGVAQPALDSIASGVVQCGCAA